VESLIRAFFADARVVTVLCLIFLQVGFAVVLALRTRTFDGGRLADYYRTKVVPYILGALIVYVATRFLPTSELGPYGALVNDGLFDIAWFTLLYTLISDIWQTGKAIGYGLPDEPPPPEPARSARVRPDG